MATTTVVLSVRIVSKLFSISSPAVASRVSYIHRCSGVALCYIMPESQFHNDFFVLSIGKISDFHLFFRRPCYVDFFRNPVHYWFCFRRPVLC